MKPAPLVRPHTLAALIAAAGLCLAAAAWACPDSPRASHCPPPPEGTGSETVLVNPTPAPEAESPTLAGLPGSFGRFRDGDTRAGEHSTARLLTSGPAAGFKLSVERLARAAERHSGTAAEGTRPAKPAAKRGSPARGGASHIARPHRMPNLEIL